MALLINIRVLERGPVRMEGQLAAGDLELTEVDELIQLEGPVGYDLEAQKLEQSVLVQGNLEVKLRCECARCLKSFVKRLDLSGWTCHLELEGDEAVPISNDCVDLTPQIREDILLELPQHPLCQPGCRGLPAKGPGKSQTTGKAGQTSAVSPDWTVLNKLKL